jgi:hypothetical protein
MTQTPARTMMDLRAHERTALIDEQRLMPVVAAGGPVAEDPGLGDCP